jgi:transposase-like protein
MVEGFAGDRGVSGSRRSDAAVATNRARVLELVATEGMSASEAARQLGIPERTARRLVGKAQPRPRPRAPKKTVAPPATDELSRRYAWEREKNKRQMAENDGKLTFRPGAAARHRRIEWLGFDMLPDEFGSGL